MSQPVYKIEVWEPGGGSALHTITDDAINIRAKHTLTQNVGTFSFMVPTVKGATNPYFYNDIDPFDKVKIWFAYDSVSGDPDFVGKVYQISALLSTPLGYRRIVKGRDQGEILQRRLKGMKKWEAVDASVIVTELANDLGLGTGEIETDTTDVTLTIDVDRYETYFNVLRAVSDYWYSAGTQIKKDFYVDIDNNLVWKSRPLRTSGVETFTVGEDIVAYQVLRDVESVKNKLYIYGSKQKARPSGRDSWTEVLTLVDNTLEHVEGTWTVFGGGSTISKDTDEIVGDYCVRTSGGSGTGLLFTFGSSYYVNANYYPSFHFQVKTESGYPDVVVTLEDSSAQEMIKVFTVRTNTWIPVNVPAGEKNEDYWQASVSNTQAFDWENIKIIEFNISNVAGVNLRIDNMFFNSRNFYGMAEDSTSQTNYGLREATFIDEALGSDSECSKRAETLLYQLKDVPIRLDIQVPGNTNLKIGDRLSMTVPAEGISSQNYDVVTVEHTVSDQGFRTNAITINTANVRTAPSATMQEILVQKFNIQKQIGKGILLVK